MSRDIGISCCPLRSCREAVMSGPKNKNHCDCCLCNKKIKASFALAWISDDSDGNCSMPQGFQFDYIDTVDKVEKKRKEFEDWMKLAPIGDCVNLVLSEGSGKFSVANGIDCKTAQEVTTILIRNKIWLNLF